MKRRTFLVAVGGFLAAPYVPAAIIGPALQAKAKSAHSLLTSSTEAGRLLLVDVGPHACDEVFLLDIATGPAGAELFLLPNILARAGDKLAFPVFVPPRSRLTYRLAGAPPGLIVRGRLLPWYPDTTRAAP